jgi:hypothetical protein
MLSEAKHPSSCLSGCLAYSYLLPGIQYDADFSRNYKERKGVGENFCAMPPRCEFASPLNDNFKSKMFPVKYHPIHQTGV